MDHPLIVVTFVAVLVGIGQAVWIWTHRRLGAFDPDEAGYIATALRYQRSLDPLHPWAFVHEVGGTGTGPMVPLLSVPLLIVGPRDPRTVMMIQPLLMAFTAVAVAGMTRRLTSSGAAIVTGSAVCILPTMLLATQSYWYGLGTAAAMAGSLWALMASERGTNRRIWWYGIGTGAMLLARTMALGFLPAMLLAGVIVVGLDRRRLIRLACSIGVTVLVAAPWWIVEWSSVTDYLVRYGYGRRAALFGSGNVFDRIGFRVHRVFDGIGGSVVVVALAIGAIGLVGAVLRWRRTGERPLGREAFLLAAVFVAGNASLVSTTNNGVWFELPLVVCVLPLGAALVGLAPRPLRWVPVVPVLGMGLVQLAVVWWWLAPTTTGVPLVATNYVTATHFEDGFEQYDERFATDRRSEQVAAAEDWRKLNESVERAMHRLDGRRGGVVFSLSGNMQLFNSNSLTLAGELDRWGARIWIPDTTAPARDRLRELGPHALDADGEVVRDDRGRLVERVLVVALHERILFTPDRDVMAFVRQARELGWKTTERFAMPGGGTVEILRLGGRSNQANG